MCVSGQIFTLPSSLLHDTNTQKFDRVVETIQDAWDGDANARLSADMVFERIRSFRTEQFCDKTTDSGLDLDVCLSVCLFVCVFVHLFVCLFIKVRTCIRYISVCYLNKHFVTKNSNQTTTSD